MTLRILACLAAIVVLAACDTGTAGSDASPARLESANPFTESPSPIPVVPVDPCHVAGVTYCALNPAVTQATIRQTICVSGWTATIRPPSSYTSPLKLQQIAAERLADTNPADYEEDHRIPLELGGAPSDTSNLSPERGASPNPKDSAENSARGEVCAGRATLRGEQAAFTATWLAAYPAYRQ